MHYMIRSWLWFIWVYQCFFLFKSIYFAFKWGSFISYWVIFFLYSLIHFDWRFVFKIIIRSLIIKINDFWIYILKISFNSIYFWVLVEIYLIYWRRFKALDFFIEKCSTHFNSCSFIILLNINCLLGLL